MYTALATVAKASTICVSGYCQAAENPPANSILPISSTPIFTSTSKLELIPYQNENGWNYSFAIGAADVVSASSPYFSSWSSSQVFTPSGWTYQVSTSNQQNDVATWAKDSSTPAGNYVTFGATFASDFAPTVATIKLTKVDGAIENTEVFIPLTPSAISAGYFAARLPVPEPSSSLLVLAGVSLLCLAQRRRTNKL